MSVAVRELEARDAEAVASLWQVAVDERRRRAGLGPAGKSDLAMSRPGVFGVGICEDEEILSIALALPAHGDDGRSTQPVPGLVHVSSVATRPGDWGRGLGRRAVRAIMLQASRRGFARAQLWTQTDSPAARHLYESLGFQSSGRVKVDDNNEPIVHYVVDLPPLATVARPAARLVCLDPAGRVLLMHWRDPADGYQLWEPPGGGIEAGESPYDAVVREWREETGLPVPRLVATPTAVAREVIFDGRRSVVDEDFFLGYADRAGEPVPDGATAVEQDAYLGYAWVDWRQLDSLAYPVEPDLTPVLRRLAPDGPWA